MAITKSKKKKQIRCIQIKQLAYSIALIAGAYAVNNFYWKSHIHLKALVNNSF